jgi:hypothetical protein
VENGGAPLNRTFDTGIAVIVHEGWESFVYGPLRGDPVVWSNSNSKKVGTEHVHISSKEFLAHRAINK